ncbi:galactokinase [Priestia megaterium]|uniref:galactokinase n=1 Tax=Priestia megaterium TaxID=1404 RepID=UPI0013F8CD71|nr:galactokinase [Priestia megaterium]NGY69861.1 galactokinase [Priestia megaterium]
MKKEEMDLLFQETFDHNDYRLFFAPGRINLIGEHTDYNGGHVFPCAITYGTYALVSKRKDNAIRLYSENFPEEGLIEFDLTNLHYDTKHSWANYAKGMINYLKQAGYKIENGLDILIHGNIPNGAGLSSSASIELVIGIALEKLFNLDIERIEIVKIGQQVENNFIGINSGIMDQFAIGMGKKDFGMLLNCQTLACEYAPIQLHQHHIVIMNTNKRRTLADSKYNERKSECEEALEVLKKVTNISFLGELTEGMFENVKNYLPNEIIQRRVQHVVSENSRTLKALRALKANDLHEFGQLMDASHCSLRDDYEVTGKELDTLVETAWNQKGVIGARMTGAGFGGCAIAIVEKEQVEQFIDKVGAIYKEKIGYEATFYVASIGDGARELTEEEDK